jgi:hypothetical protein
MPLGLITLPLRIGLRVAGILLRPVGDLVEHALHTEPDQREAPPQEEPVRPVTPVPEPRREPESRADVPDEPEHVSEEPVVVAEVADPGAEEGPGPEISVAEPWDGYRQMKAADIVDRLAAATPAELAVVQLYESTHKRRKTVLEAAAYSQRK